MVHEHGPANEARIFLHLNLSYELTKHVKRNSCHCHFDGRISVVRTISLLTSELAYSISILIPAMLLTRCAKIDSLIQYY